MLHQSARSNVSSISLRFFLHITRSPVFRCSKLPGHHSSAGFSAQLTIGSIPRCWRFHRCGPGMRTKSIPQLGETDRVEECSGPIASGTGQTSFTALQSEIEHDLLSWHRDPGLRPARYFAYWHDDLSMHSARRSPSVAARCRRFRGHRPKLSLAVWFPFSRTGPAF